MTISTRSLVVALDATLSARQSLFSLNCHGDLRFSGDMLDDDVVRQIDQGELAALLETISDTAYVLVNELRNKQAA